MLNSQMAVNLLGLAILAEQSSQCPHPPHPDYLLGESGICCTLPFTIAWGRGEVCGREGRGRKRERERETDEGTKERKGEKGEVGKIVKHSVCP